MDQLDALDSLSRDSFSGDEHGRIRALNKARALCQRLETPWEVLYRECWLTPSLAASIKIAQDSKLFEVLTEQTTPKTSDELGKLTGTDPEFVGRILWMLAANGYVDENEIGSWSGNQLTKAFTGPGYVGGMVHMFSQTLPTFTHFPRYMAENNYMTPKDPANSAFKYGLKTSETFYEWLNSHAHEGKSFHEMMGLFHQQDHLQWTDIYPVGKLVEGVQLEPGRPLVVDVGGGVGRDMDNLRQKLLPETHTLIVQDLEEVVQHKHDVDASIQFQVHDFFTEQPIQGARAYYMHNNLHDWSDNDCHKILAHLKNAMKVGYSRLLICETILPVQAQIPLCGALDLVLMSLLSTGERTEKAWRELLHSAGFEVTNIYGKDDEMQCVIEAEPVA